VPVAASVFISVFGISVFLTASSIMVSLISVLAIPIISIIVAVCLLVISFIFGVLATVIPLMTTLMKATGVLKLLALRMFLLLWLLFPVLVLYD
jgi:hypothetical protein